ncbi:MAG: glucose-6-phosphate isomerase [Victivallaceae bacterium]|nr:hypothetical protein [Victivallaceae bacterium]
MDRIERETQYTLGCPELRFSLDVAGMKFTDGQLDEMLPALKSAYAGMKAIEAGEIKNPDENRKVTHFTDRIEYSQSELFAAVKNFADGIAQGKILSASGKKFTQAVINGIGGSALGPQLMQFAINGPYWNELSEAKRRGYLKIYFLDNTDPAGIADLEKVLDPETALAVTISKSGGTQETQNNLNALESLFDEAGVDLPRQSAVITMRGSKLWKYAESRNYLRIFEMAESIGGRTSETSVVGHLPAALAGIDFAEFLRGACKMDAWTRIDDFESNPAYLLAAMWYIAGNGRGDRNMVIVPYSDRLVLLSRYLQQLVMESLGKEKDLDGNTVNQGLNVFGNKGGTDAHAFIQQLNDGRDDFFVTFIEVLKDAANLDMGGDMAMGDYLHGFLEGLSAALQSKGRQVIRITIDELNPAALGMLIALYERAVAVYAELIHINAFHQPGVQAYKLAAKDVLAFRAKLFDNLAKLAPVQGSAAELAERAGCGSDPVLAAGLLNKAAVNGEIDREFRDLQWIYRVK